MNFTKIVSMTFSLLKKTGEAQANNLVEFEKKKSVKFILPQGFPRTEEYIEAMCADMYKDLMQDSPEGIDPLGLWIEMDSITLSNSILLSTLEAIHEYSLDKDINVAYEFFKMTYVED